MDEELKGRISELLRNGSDHRGEMADAILALVVAERDAALDAASLIPHNGLLTCDDDTDCDYCDLRARISRKILELKSAPSTAQSREREIRADELALLNKHLEHNEWASVGSNCCDDYVAARIAELFASSQPKGACDD